MDAELLSVLLEASIGVIAILVISFLFWQMMKSHRIEREEWRKSADDQADKVSKAIDHLASSINDNKRM